MTRVILAGGGTGGHMDSGHRYRQRTARSIWCRGRVHRYRARIETRLVPAAGYRLELVKVGALNQVSAATRVKTLFDLPRAGLHCLSFFKEFKPDVVISVGGYASGPAMMAVAMSGVPSVIFEPNLVPGFANRMAARWAKAACVHFEDTCRFFKYCTVTGVPVRKAFFDIQSRAADSTPSLLVFGGSQGARAINNAVVAALPMLKQKLPQLKIVHQTGPKELDAVLSGYASAGVTADVKAFIDDMPGAFADADLIVCRSGASTVAEVAAAGKTAIFIPLPTAADDHQTKNAEALAKANAGILMPQSGVTPEKLASGLLSCFRIERSCRRCRRMRSGCRTRMRRDKWRALRWG